MEEEEPLHTVSEVSPTLPLKQFQCSSDWWWPSLVLSRKLWSASSFHASLLQETYSVMPLALCPQVMSWAPQHFRHSKTQATGVGFFPPHLLGHFLPFRHVQGGRPTERMSAIDTFQSGLPIPLFTFCSKLTESVRADGMGVLSPLEVIQWTSWWLLTPLLSNWNHQCTP